MRRSAAAVTSVLWFAAVGGTFGCLLPYLSNDWRFRQPLPYWGIGRSVGVLMICAGLIPVAGSFISFVKAGGTPVPAASPPRLVVTGFYRYVRNPIYTGFLVTLTGQSLLFGSRGLAEYTAVAWCVGAAVVRFYEEPVLTRKFGAEYQAYRRAVPAWMPRLHAPQTSRADPSPSASPEAGRQLRLSIDSSPPVWLYLPLCPIRDDTNRC